MNRPSQKSAMNAPEIPAYSEVSGFFWTGEQPDGSYLALIDLDPLPGIKLTIDDIIELQGEDSIVHLENSWIDQACRGGLHVLVKIPPTKRGNLHRKLKGHPRLAGVDINICDSKCIAAGSFFTTTKHGEPYVGERCITLQANEPVELTKIEMNMISTALTGEAIYGTKAKRSFKKAKRGEHVSPGGKLDIPAAPPTKVIPVNERFPPCMNVIAAKMAKGEHLEHQERLAIAFYLIQCDVPANAIVEWYSRLPDFKREYTTYMINHAVQRGYSSFGCAKLVMQNMCPYKCRDFIKNPIEYRGRKDDQETKKIT